MSKDKRDTKIENKLKEIREKEESEKSRNAVENYKKELENERAAARASELEKIMQNFYHEDENGKKTNEWDKSNHQAAELISKGITSVHDWKSLMLDLLQMFACLCGAIYGSIHMNIRHPLKQLVVDQLILGGIKDRFISAEPPSEISLPSLEHNVTFTDDNKLKIDPLIRSDNVDNKDFLATERQQLDQLFEKGVIRWLDDNGYKPHPTEESRFVHQQTGKDLDKTTFNALKEGENGLQHFLSEESDLVFRPTTR